jgi:uncharacterized membrane protein
MAAASASQDTNSTFSASNLMREGRDALGADTVAEAQELPIMQAVRMIGGAVVGIAVIVLVVNEVLTIDAVDNSSGPFAGVISSLETTGVAAMTLLVVGLVVVAAQQIMGFMGGGF